MNNSMCKVAHCHEGLYRITVQHQHDVWNKFHRLNYSRTDTQA